MKKIVRWIDCEYLEWEFKCPKKWEELELTGEDDVRFCTSCGSHVFFCESKAQLQELAIKGKCAAHDSPLVEGITIGQPSMPKSELSELSEFAQKWKAQTKIRQLQERIEEHGESPAVLERLSKMYRFIGDTEKAKEVESRI